MGFSKDVKSLALSRLYKYGRYAVDNSLPVYEELSKEGKCFKYIRKTNCCYNIQAAFIYTISLLPLHEADYRLVKLS